MSQDKFQNKYRNGTFRAQWWDYGWNGAYFITICTQNREHFFGEIENGKMILSHTGVIANLLWNEIPKHHQNIELGDFVVMPNHIHGILIIDKPNDGRQTQNGNGQNGNNVNDGYGHIENDGCGHIVGAGHALHLQYDQYNQYDQNVNQQYNDHQNNPNHQNLNPTPGSQRFQNIGKNTISSVVGSYKSAVTKYANRLGFSNGWQRLFHEHIIRNDAEYQRISDYITNNPKNWCNDTFTNPKFKP